MIEDRKEGKGSSESRSILSIGHHIQLRSDFYAIYGNYMVCLIRSKTGDFKVKQDMARLQRR